MLGAHLFVQRFPLQSSEGGWSQWSPLQGAHATHVDVLGCVRVTQVRVTVRAWVGSKGRELGLPLPGAVSGVQFHRERDVGKAHTCEDVPVGCLDGD